MIRVVDALNGLWKGEERRFRLADILIVFVLALGVRIAAAVISYPAQGDASHFVQYGVRIAHGHPEALSAYWSIAPQYLAAAATAMNISPSRTLQVSTLCFGLLLVVVSMRLAYRLFDSWPTAVVTGLFVATNPALVDSSVSGLSETPHIACLLSGYALLLDGLRARGRQCAGLFAAGAVFLALDLYYRPVELILGVGLAMLFVVWRVLAGDRRADGLIGIAVFVAVFAFLALPFAQISREKGAVSASNTKLAQLAYGDYGTDSKVLRSAFGPRKDGNPFVRDMEALESYGAARFLWMHRGPIAARFARNVGSSIRVVKDHLFPGAFLMGMGWFVLLLAVVLVDQWTRRPAAAWSLPLAYVVVLSASVCISFVHPRWLLQTIPFVVMLIADSSVTAISRSPRGWHRAAAFAILLLFMGRTAVWADRSLLTKWTDMNTRAVGAELRALGTDRDVLMCFGPELAVEFYTSNPLAYAEIPYGEVGEVEQYAEEKKVTLVVLSDRRFPHYPVNRLFKQGSAPPNWELVKTMDFAKNTMYGAEEEHVRIYRRHPVERSDNGRVHEQNH